MAQKIVTLSAVTVSTAGTRVRISSSSIAIKAITIQASSGNSGIIYVGDSSVSSSNGIALSAKDSVSITPEAPDFELNLSDYYIDAATNGDSVHVSYITIR